MISYAFKTSDGKTQSDYYRFCQNESFPDYQIRSVNIASGGYSANKQIQAGGKPFTPRELLYVAIYSNSIAHKGKPQAIQVDYLRVTKQPLKMP